MNGNIRIVLLLTLFCTAFGATAAGAADTRPPAPMPAARQAAPRAEMPKAQPESVGRAVPSFNCARASNAVERAVCTDPALAELDVRVAVEYRKALGLHADKEALRANQRQWLREMHGQCATAPAPCAQKYYRVRLTQLVQHNEQAAPAR